MAGAEPEIIWELVCYCISDWVQKRTEIERKYEVWCSQATRKAPFLENERNWWTWVCLTSGSLKWPHDSAYSAWIIWFWNFFHQKKSNHFFLNILASLHLYKLQLFNTVLSAIVTRNTPMGHLMCFQVLQEGSSLAFFVIMELTVETRFGIARAL